MALNDNIFWKNIWKGMSYPAGNRDFDRFEETNKNSISVDIYNIFEFEGTSTIVLHRRTNVVGAKHHANRLKTEDEKGKCNHVLITDYDNLDGNQTN